MKKVIIDTNVIVSSIIQRNYPYLIISELFIENKFELCISDSLLSEYIEVLSRQKFSKYEDFRIKAESLLAEIVKRSKNYKPTIEIDIIADKDDNMILELAYECKADFIVTGNSNDFRMKKYNQT